MKETSQIKDQQIISTIPTIKIKFVLCFNITLFNPVYYQQQILDRLLDEEKLQDILNYAWQEQIHKRVKVFLQLRFEILSQDYRNNLKDLRKAQNSNDFSKVQKHEETKGEIARKIMFISQCEANVRLNWIDWVIVNQKYELFEE